MDESSYDQTAGQDNSRDSYSRFEIESLLIEKAYSLQKSEDVTLENMYDLERPVLVKGVIDKLKTEWKPSLEEVEQLTCILIRDKASAWYSYVNRKEEIPPFDDSLLPWPVYTKEPKTLSSKQWEEYVATDEDEEYYGDGLLNALQIVISRLDDDTSSVYSKYIYENMSQLAKNYYPSLLFEMDFLAHINIKSTGPLSEELSSTMISFIRANYDYIQTTSFMDSDNKEHLNSSSNNESPQRIDIYNTNVRTNEQMGFEVAGVVLNLFGQDKELVLRGIARLDPEEQQEYMSTILRLHGLPVTLNALRSLYFNKDLENERIGIESLMKPFWKDVVGDGEFQPDILAFYDTYGYADYPLTPEETIKRKEMLNERLPQLGIKKGAKIAEIACGIGMLTDQLSDTYDVVGVDINPNHIKEAHRRFPDHKFVTGSWFDLTKIEEIQGSEVVIVDGRSFPHLETLENFYKVIDQCAQLKIKALIYTFPDSNLGTIEMRREKLSKVMEKYGYSKEWLEKHFHDAVGKLGNNLSNRWLPSEGLLTDATEAGGFKVTEVVREKNYDNCNNDNLVFICPYEQDQISRIQMRRGAFSRLDERTSSQTQYPNPNGTFVHYLPDPSLRAFSR